MTRRTSATTDWRSIEPAPIALPRGWGRGSLLTGRAAVRLPLFVLDLVDALTAPGRVRIEGPARVLTPVMTAGGAGAVEADPGAPPGEDAHDATVVSRREKSAHRPDLCQAVVLRVAWTLCDLAGRTVPDADDIAEALGMRLQRVAA
jgi:hypothetical protein